MYKAIVGAEGRAEERKLWLECKIIKVSKFILREKNLLLQNEREKQKSEKTALVGHLHKYLTTSKCHAFYLFLTENIPADNQL